MSIDSKLQLINESHSAAQKTSAYARITALFDAGSFSEIDALVKSGDEPAEVIAGFGLVEGLPVYAFAQNDDIAGGAVSRAQAAKVKKIYDLAVKTGCPVVAVFSSNGARLKEGNDILAAYGEMLLWSNNLSGVVPQVALVLGPCVGTSALIASSSDIVIMKKDVAFGIDTAGKNGCAVQQGVAHIVCEDDAQAISQARRVIGMLPSNNLSPAPVAEFSEPDSSLLMTYASQQGSAEVAAATIQAIVDAGSFVELQSEFGEMAITGLASICGGTVGIIAMNGGKLDSDSSSKIARTVRFCDAFAIPVVTFVDTEGFASLRDASKVAHSYAEATAAKVSVITGAAYGAAFIAFAGRSANADASVAWPCAVVSPLAPETATALLWSDRLAKSKDPVSDRKKLVEEYKDTEGSAFSAAADGQIDDIINPVETRARLFSCLEMLAGKRITGLPKKHSNIQL